MCFANICKFDWQLLDVCAHRMTQDSLAEEMLYFNWTLMAK